MNVSTKTMRAVLNKALVILVLQFVAGCVDGTESTDGADIFGLKRGMTRTEVRALGLGELMTGEWESIKWNDITCLIKYPLKPEDAQILNLKFPNDRLLHISAYYYLETDRYGTQLKEKYQSLKNSLRDTYAGHGSEKEIDHLALSSILDKPEDYMLSISTGERKLGYGVRLSPDNKWQLSAVGVVVHPDRINEATIEVLYAFQGWDEYFKSRKRKEALEF